MLANRNSNTDWNPPKTEQLSLRLIILEPVAGLITPSFSAPFQSKKPFVVSLNWISTSHCWFVKVVLSTRPTPSCCQKIATWLQSQTFNWPIHERLAELQSNWKFHTHNNLYKGAFRYHCGPNGVEKGHVSQKISILFQFEMWKSHRNSNPIWKSIRPKNALRVNYLAGSEKFWIWFWTFQINLRT